MDEQARSLVVVGASAGGVEALKELVAELPPDLPAAVGIVLHVSPWGGSRLPQILTRAGRLPVTHAVDGEPIRPGRVYVAPPDRHLLVRDGTWAVARGPRENNARPAIDPLFRSAAAARGRRVVAVVLSGALADGAAGAAAISSVGGTVVVQDPGEATFPDMPTAAIVGGHPDHVLPLREIAALVARCAARLAQEEPVSDNERTKMTLETSFAALDRRAVDESDPPGQPSRIACPACGGVLWEIDDGESLRFRCRVGHAYGADGVLAAQDESVEDALWVALRALLERAELARRTAQRMRERGIQERVVSRFDVTVEEAHEQADLIRRVLLERDGHGA